jgi:hypothetical protein
METTRFVVIGGIGIVVVACLIVVCVTGGIFYPGLSSELDKTEAEGVEFGKHSDQLRCQQESLRRLRTALKNHDIIRRREAEVFAFGCFETCRATSGFCTAAPKEDDFLVITRWALDQCQKEGFGGDDACVDVFKESADACLGKTKQPTGN